MRTLRNCLILTAAWTALAAPAAICQSAKKLPQFEVASIKLHNPNAGGIAGFYSFQGGGTCSGQRR
jgi:hypothetical protein